MVASKCASVRNYNSLKAVLAGLQCTPVHRLTKTWKEVSSRKKKRFRGLTELMSEEENWRVYRKEIELRMTTSTCFIPFLGVYLSDMAMSQEARSLAQSRQPRHNPLYDTYTILEPITIRHKLERLRSTEDNEVDHGDSSFSTHSDSDDDDDDDVVDTFQPLSPLRLPLSDPDWSVADWLFGIQLEQYTQAFLDNGYETVELCSNLTGTDLTAIGVSNRQHRSILHTASRRLLDPTPTSPPPHSGSLECLLSAVQEGTGLIHKSNSTRSLTEPSSAGHKRTLSALPGPSSTSSIDSHRRAHSDTSTVQSSFSGLPPQLPLHSQQSGHRYSPIKESKSRTESFPLIETASAKIKSWLSDHQHKGNFPVIKKRMKSLAHTSSSPVLIQRPRRDNAPVPRLTTWCSDNPLDWLVPFQFQSIRCTTDLESNAQLRLLLTKAPHNTEALNYKISYQLETV